MTFPRLLTSLIAISLILPILAIAAPKKTLAVNVIILEADHPSQCSRKATLFVIDEARRLLEPIIALKVKVHAAPHPFMFANTTARAAELRRYLANFREQYPELRRRPAHFIVPGLRGANEEHWYTAGLAPVCHSKSASFSTCLEANDLGTPRIYQSAVSMAHELLHVVGALHYDNEINIMEIGALYSSTQQYPLPILQRTFKQVRQCGIVRPKRFVNGN